MSHFDLERFVKAQDSDYAVALSEIKRGRKVTHWMWYVFPQFEGLGRSSTAKYYGIGSLYEAREYLAHPVLGARLLEITKSVLEQPGRNARALMGYPDNMKLKSCMTLFKQVSAAFPNLACADEALFARVLDEFFDGQECETTLTIPVFPE